MVSICNSTHQLVLDHTRGEARVGRFLARLLLILLFALNIVSVDSITALAQSKFSASDWMKLDTRTKLALMKGFIATAKKDGVIMRFPPEYYVKEIDATIENAIRNRDEKGLVTSVGLMIHTIAAMDGDWDNGESKLEHAQKWLGPQLLENVRAQSPKKYEMLRTGRRQNSETWTLHGYSPNRTFYYHSASINYVSMNVVKVWVRVEYKDVKIRLDELAELHVYKPEYGDYIYDLYLYELRCDSPEFAIRADYIYKPDGGLIHPFDFPQKWMDISSHSVVGVLSKRLCFEARNINGPDIGKR